MVYISIETQFNQTGDVNNPIILRFLKRNPKMIIWNILSKNPMALLLLKKNLENVKWNVLCDNSNGLDIHQRDICQTLASALVI